MVEHCVSAFLQKQEERRYRAYVTDALMVIAGNTANFAGGSTLTERWAAAFEPRDERDGDAIAADIIRRAGLKAKEGGDGDGA